MKFLARKLSAIVCMVGLLYGLKSSAEGWSQNLDAKPVELPLGLKFGEVYEGAAKPTLPTCATGMPYSQTVITNNWLGFEEIVVTTTGKKRVSMVAGVRKDLRDFDEAMTNLVALKETLSQKYGIRFMGNMNPSKEDGRRWLSIMGIGAGDERLDLNAETLKGEGEGKPGAWVTLLIASQAAVKIEAKEREAEAAEQSADLQAAIKKVLGVDFDAPRPGSSSSFSWERLPTPIEGLTERCYATWNVLDSRRGNSKASVSFRRVFNGDVSAAELEAAARRVAAALEKAYGRKLTYVPRDSAVDREHGVVRAAYDMCVGGEAANQHVVVQDCVGSLDVIIEYAEPRYALRDGKYELVFKGGIQLTVSRSGWRH